MKLLIHFEQVWLWATRISYLSSVVLHVFFLSTLREKVTMAAYLNEDIRRAMQKADARMYEVKEEYCSGHPEYEWHKKPE